MAGGFLDGIIGAVLPGVLRASRTMSVSSSSALFQTQFARAQAQKEVEEGISVREAEVASVIAEQNKAQNDINLAEAQGNDRFSSRWRPALGWACVLAFVYQLLLAPILTWCGTLVGVAFGFAFPASPTLTVKDFMPVLVGIL